MNDAMTNDKSIMNVCEEMEAKYLLNKKLGVVIQMNELKNYINE